MQVGIIGAPLALGQRHDGVQLAPQALRDAGLVKTLESLGYTVHDYGDLPFPQRASETSVLPPYYAELIGQACIEIAQKVTCVLQNGSIPLTLGGDHSIGMGTVCGVLRARPDAVLLWIDAHGDINTPDTSPSGNVHGMALAALLGLIEPPLYPEPCLSPQHFALIGTHSLDPGERRRLREMHGQVATMYDIDRDGIQKNLTRILNTLDPEGRRPIHVSFDIDVVDPSEAPGTGSAVRGGLSYREAHFLLELIAETDRLCAFDMVEINPLLDRDDRTVQLGIELIDSAFGQRIL